MRTWYVPRRGWKWTRWSLVAAGIFFCVLYVQAYRDDWSAAQRLYLMTYLKSGVWGTLSMDSSTRYTLLEGVTAKKQALFVSGDEIEPVTSPYDEPTYRLTEAGTLGGLVRLEWRTDAYNDRRLHAFLHKWVFRDQLRESVRRPFCGALVLLALLLPLAIPRDRWPTFSYEKLWRRWVGWMEHRKRAAAPAIKPPVPAVAPAPVARPKAPSEAPAERPAAVKKPRPRFE